MITTFDRVSSVIIEDKYADIFSGKLGMLPGLQHLNVNKDAKPVVMPGRRIPVVRPKLRAELDIMIDIGVIMPVDEPTP